MFFNKQTTMSVVNFKSPLQCLSDFYPEIKLFLIWTSKYLGVLHSSTTTSQTNLTLDPISVYLWDLPPLKKAISVIHWKSESTLFLYKSLSLKHNLIQVNRMGSPDALGLQQDVFSDPSTHPFPDFTTLLFHPPHLHNLILAYLFLILCLYLSLPYTLCVALTPASTGSLRQGTNPSAVVFPLFQKVTSKKGNNT